MLNKQKIELEFPYHIIDGVAGEFARLYSSHMESPIEFLYISFLTCLGCVLADRLTLNTEIEPQPRLYVVILGESADDRKSTAIKKTMELFEDKLEYCLGVGSAEGLQKQLQKNNQLLLVFDEFKQFVSKSSIDSSVLLPCVNTLFELNNYESHTKSSSINVDNAYLSMLSASTVETYERTWDASFTDIGFNNRLFLVPANGTKKFSIPPVISDDAKRQISSQIGEIIGFVGRGMRLTIEPEALRTYDDWYMNLPKSEHAKRLDTYALRFMALLAVNERKKVVDLITVQRAIFLMDWELGVRRLYDPIDADSAIAKMEEKIRRQLENRGSLTDRDLKRFCNARKSGYWVYNKALENLLEAGEITYVSNSSTSKTWSLEEEVS
ncbi:hypothetical protein ACFL6P_08575 [Candidatus Latescibacterota bacterium]